MDQLRIHLLGGLEVHAGRHLLPDFATEKSRSLFGFLVFNRERRFHRDVLCGHFWGDQPDTTARKALRTALWRIRSVLEPEEGQRGTRLHVEGQLVGFPGGRETWVDTDEFDAQVSVAVRTGSARLTREDASRLARAVALYRGDLLEGNYDEWCLVVRDRLRLNFLMALERLVAYHRERREWLDAIRRGSEVLRHDPLREHIHRAIMLCHVAMGDRPSALRQYETLAAILRRELDIAPMEETRRLYSALRADDPLPLHVLCGAEGEALDGTGLAASQVEETLAAVYALARRLERARTALGT